MDKTTGTMTHRAFGDVPVSYTLTPMSVDADTRVSQTIAVMSRYAVEDSVSPEVWEDAQSATALGGGDPIFGVWKLCKERFRFVNDHVLSDDADLPQEIKGTIVEVLIRPRDVSKMWRMNMQPLEDCDGYSTYAASLLLALGIPCYFCTVAVDPSVPDEYSHVYLVAYDRGGRIAIDASHGEYCGWECPNPFGKRKEWFVEHVPLTGYFLLAGCVALLAWAMKGIQ